MKLDPNNNYDIEQKRLGLLKVNENTNLDLQDNYNVVNSKQQSFTHLKENYDSLVSFNDVNDIFFKS